MVGRLITKCLLSGAIVGASSVVTSFLPFGRGSYLSAVLLPYLVAAFLLFGLVYAHAHLGWRLGMSAVVAAVVLLAATPLNNLLVEVIYMWPLALQFGALVALLTFVFTTLALVGAWLASLAHVELLQPQE